jgi:hypothetical protein
MSRHVQHVGRQDESDAAQDRKSIQSRRHVVGIRTDPRSHAELRDDVRDQRLGCPALQVGIVLLCPPLQSEGPCRIPVVFSSTVPASIFTHTVPSVVQAQGLPRSILSPEQRAKSRGGSSRDVRPWFLNRMFRRAQPPDTGTYVT